MAPSGRQTGVTLIELVIALALGLVLIGGAVAVTIDTSRRYRNDEALARLQENARHALRVLADDVAHAGFWGELVDPNAIDTGTVSIATGDDCGIGPNWAVSPSPAVESMVRASPAAIAAAYPCIRSGHVLEGTDVLAVKRVEGRRRSSERADPGDDGELFLRTDNEAGAIVRYDHELGPYPGDLAAPGPGVYDWRLLTHVYYIRKESVAGLGDGIPTLYRKRIRGAAMRDDPGGIASGIEYFHVAWGIDESGDGIPDTYRAEPADKAVSARIYVLARTLAQDPAYANEDTYEFGLDRDGNPVRIDFARAPDGYRRRVLVTTVRLPNHAHRRQLM